MLFFKPYIRNKKDTAAKKLYSYFKSLVNGDQVTIYITGCFKFGVYAIPAPTSFYMEPIKEPAAEQDPDKSPILS